MDRRARAVYVGHYGTVWRFAQSAKREAYAILIAGVANTRDAQPYELFQAGQGKFQQVLRGLFQMCHAFVRIQLTAFKKKMRMALDQPWQQRVVRKGRIGLSLPGNQQISWRRIFAHEENVVPVIDDVRISQRQSAESIQNCSNSQPDGALIRRGGNDHDYSLPKIEGQIQRSTVTASLQSDMMASTWR